LLLALALYYWWRGPVEQVPPHLSDSELRRLEVQDRLRQTNYQLVTAVGLLATFAATFAQVSLNSQQWNTDYRLRLDHEQAQVFSDAMSELAKDQAGRVGGHAVYRLRGLALQNPQAYFIPVSDALISFVRTSTRKNDLGWSQECSLEAQSYLNPFADFNRQEGPEGALAALSVLGDPSFARFGIVYSREACHQSGLLRIDADQVRLDHFKLDNFDLGNRDFSCSSMTQARLHRVNFRGTKLAGANLSGALLADFDISGTPAATGAFHGGAFSTLAYKRIPEWQRYRCFSADISRARFTDVHGLTNKMISSACVGQRLSYRRL
jgi:hypothetical protein